MQGAQLQDHWTNGQVVVLQFYKFKELYLVLDTNPRRPLALYLEEEPRVEKRPKPLMLFLNSNAKNLRWEKCEVKSEKGRVLDIELSGGARRCHLEIRLIPNAFNILAEAHDVDGAKKSVKKISWEKPRELPPSQAPDAGEEAGRNWLKAGQQWLSEKQKKSGPSAAGAGAGGAGATPKKSDQRIRDIEKKSKALQSIEESLKSDAASQWNELGEILKYSGDIPEHLKALNKSDKSRSWNMENAFAQAKSLKKKRAGTEERAQKLREEIAKLQKSIEEHPEPIESTTAPSAASRLLQKANKKSEAKGRRLQLDENFEAVMGKSARDNLEILRQAQAWDLWMHLKDYPGAHAIIVRPRQKEVPLKHIQKVSEWLIRETIGQKKVEMGSKYDVVVVECRYVRPIKGDKLGRVTYHNPQVYSFASKS